MANTANESFQAYLRSLDLLRQDVYTAAVNLVAEISKGVPAQQRMAAAIKLEDTLRPLNSTLVDQDRPDWLKWLNSAVGRFETALRRGEEGRFVESIPDALDYLVPAIRKAREHRWKFAEREDFALDFDGIFERYRSQSRLPELLDKLIEILERLADAPELDSKRVLESLRKMIDTLKRAKGGSWYSVMMTLDFGSVFVKKFARNLSNRIPIIGEAVNALDETWDEFAKEVTKVQVEMHDEVITMAEADLQRLPQPLAIAGDAPKALPDILATQDNIIDAEFEKK